MNLKNLKAEYFYINPEVLNRISKKLEEIGYKRVYVIRRSLTRNDVSKYIVIAESTTDSKLPYMFTFYNDEDITFSVMKADYSCFDECFSSALDRISNNEELEERNRFVLNIRLQDLYDILCQVVNLSPAEWLVESNEWEDLFIECVNLEQAFKDIGTRDGIVPKYED